MRTGGRAARPGRASGGCVASRSPRAAAPLRTAVASLTISRRRPPRRHHFSEIRRPIPLHGRRISRMRRRTSEMRRRNRKAPPPPLPSSVAASPRAAAASPPIAVDPIFTAAGLTRTAAASPRAPSSSRRSAAAPAKYRGRTSADPPPHRGQRPPHLVAPPAHLRRPPPHPSSPPPDLPQSPWHRRRARALRSPKNAFASPRSLRHVSEPPFVTSCAESPRSLTAGKDEPLAA